MIASDTSTIQVVVGAAAFVILLVCARWLVRGSRGVLVRADEIPVAVAAAGLLVTILVALVLGSAWIPFIVSGSLVAFGWALRRIAGPAQFGGISLKQLGTLSAAVGLSGIVLALIRVAPTLV